jgi:hypothetical protein
MLLIAFSYALSINSTKRGQIGGLLAARFKRATSNSSSSFVNGMTTTSSSVDIFQDFCVFQSVESFFLFLEREIKKKRKKLLQI